MGFIMRRGIGTWACILGCVGLGLAASPDGPAPRVDVVFARNLIVVDQKVVAGAQGAVVPVCDVGGEDLLCLLAVHIEVQSGPRWVPASLSHVAGVPGGIPLERAKVIKVEPGASANIRVTFLKRDYLLKPGQLVRLRIDTWPTE